MKIFIAVFLLISLNANADSLDVNIASLHVGSSNYNFNQENLGLGYTYDISDYLDASAGFYKNSYYKTSTYLMIGLHQDMGWWDFGFKFGVVTGYDDIAVKNGCTGSHNMGRYTTIERPFCEKGNGLKNYDKYQIMAMPTLTVKHDNHALQIGLIPGVKVSAFTLQYRFLF
ncbi:MAG: hypothetical protein ACC707_01685 [Thiohalomonadales bacterium]